MSAHTPLYLIPGTMCDARLWGRMLPHMNSANVAHADYTGSETMEAMLEKVMDGAPNEPCHLVGFSLGGYLAMMAATHAASRFKSLTVIAASPYGLSDDEKALRQRNAEMLTRLTYRACRKRGSNSLWRKRIWMMKPSVAPSSRWSMTLGRMSLSAS